MERTIQMTSLGEKQPLVVSAGPKRNSQETGRLKDSKFFRRHISEREYYHKQDAVINAVKQPQFSATNLDQALDNLVQFICSKVIVDDPVQKVEQQVQLLHKAYEEMSQELATLEQAKRNQFAQHFDDCMMAHLLKWSPIDMEKSAAFLRDFPEITKTMQQGSALSQDREKTTSAAVGSQFTPQSLLQLSQKATSFLQQREKQIKDRIFVKIQKLMDQAKHRKITQDDVIKALGTDLRYVDRASLKGFIQALEILRDASAQLPALRKSIETTEKKLARTVEEFRKADDARDRLDAANAVKSTYGKVYAALSLDILYIPGSSSRGVLGVDYHDMVTDNFFRHSEKVRATNAQDVFSALDMQVSQLVQDPFYPPEIPEKKTKACNGPSVDKLREMYKLRQDLGAERVVLRKLKESMEKLELERFNDSRAGIHAHLTDLLSRYKSEIVYSAPKNVQEAEALVESLRQRIGTLGREMKIAEFESQLRSEKREISNQEVECKFLMELSAACGKWIQVQQEFEKQLTELSSQVANSQESIMALEKKIDNLNNTACTISQQYLFDTTKVLGITRIDWKVLDSKYENLAFGKFKKAWEKKAQKKADYQNAWVACQRAKEECNDLLTQNVTGANTTIQTYIDTPQTMVQHLGASLIDTKALQVDVKNTPTELQANVQKIYEATLSAAWDKAESRQVVNTEWKNKLANRMLILVGKINRPGQKTLNAADLALLVQAKKYMAQVGLSTQHIQAIEKDDGRWSEEAIEAYSALLTACHECIIS